MYKSNTNCPDFTETFHTQLPVAGGGLAGTVPPIAAPREGIKTVILQNRPVLGGISSCEYGEGNGGCVNGAYNYIHRNARECGIIEELKNENAYLCENGYETCWSHVLREALENEENITLLMNTEALSVEMEGKRIRSIRARGINREIDYTIFADYFIDATGDGFFAASGAEFRMGREGKREFGEELAPDEPDTKTMGSSIAFKAHDAGHKVAFKPPKGALHFTDEDLPYRDHSILTHGYWWLEYGGELDTIKDNEVIYRKLKNILFGLWDHVKNGGDHGADNFVIDWIAPITGKRESRRFVGDWMLSQKDIMENRDFEDAVAYGGWPIDIHPPEGIFGHGHPGSEPPFTFPPLYAIPFRSLYSRNIANLLMAGRDISVTHVALGTTRVMATGAVCAQAAGTAVALLEKYSCTPRELYENHLEELRCLLQKNDSLLPGRPVAVPGDLVRKAELSSSSFLSLRMMESNGEELLTWGPKPWYDPCDVPPDDRRKGQFFPIVTGKLDKILLKIHNNSSHAVPLTGHLKKEAFGEDIGEVTVTVPAGKNNIVELAFNLELENGTYALILDPAEELSLPTSNIHLPGVLRKADGCYHNYQNMIFQVLPEQPLYPPGNLQNDFGRPAENAPNIWIAEEGFPQTVTVNWKEEVTFDQLDIVFDTNLDERRFYLIPIECIKDFEVNYWKDGVKTPLLRVSDNHVRFRRFHFPEITTAKLEIRLLNSNGDKFARLYGIHAYKKD